VETPTHPALDRGAADVVLIVDDTPDNLSGLHDALDESGYIVLVATDGESALQRALQAQPDVVLLDAVMPGLDGFEVARRLKARPETAHIPIIFMTGLTETEHVVAALQSGGVDYVTKPIRAREVIARIQVHLQSARQARHARNALDAFGHAAFVVRAADAAMVWGTPLARRLLALHFADGARAAEVVDWVRSEAARRAAGQPPAPLTLQRPSCKLVFTMHEEAGEDEWLVVMRESSDGAAIEAIGATLHLTTREAEVLYWVVKGKTNRDVGEILGASPATVKKHLERIYEKLGVETRTAAASLAMNKVRLLAAGGPMR
jgi:DNA-binding response OmpR family regulator/DNA-binding CsgD family transcriptional regulator